MLNGSAESHDSTSIPNALPGKLEVDIKRHSTNILYLYGLCMKKSKELSAQSSQSCFHTYKGNSWLSA